MCLVRRLFHSHGISVSAGVAILFSIMIGATNIQVTELEQRRVLMVQAEIKSID